MLTKFLLPSLLTKTCVSRFSSAQKIADWQYVAKIHKSLKDNKVFEALNYLINSHLDGVVLDRQTFYNVHLKMNETKVDPSYQQIAYKLYRESFSPHLLMAEWMKIVADSQNKKLLELVQRDFKALNLQIPKKIVAEIPTKQPQISAKNTKIVQQQYKSSYQQKKAGQKIVSKAINEQISPKVAQIIEKAANLQQIANMLKNNHDIKIVIQDFQLEMKNDDKDDYKAFEGDQYEQQQQQEEGQIGQMQELLYKIDGILDVLSSISKVKIGKIDVTILNKPDGTGSSKDK